jgi:chorismate mutase
MSAVTIADLVAERDALAEQVAQYHKSAAEHVAKFDRKHKRLMEVTAERDALAAEVAAAKADGATAILDLVDGWHLEADEDGTVELYHEHSSLPMMSNARYLGAILAFIADSQEALDVVRALGRDGEVDGDD